MKNSYGLSQSLIEAAKQVLKESTGEKYKKYADFNNRILVLGYGSVGQAIVPLLLRHLNVKQENITILEKDDHQELFDKRHGNTKIKYIKNVNIVRSNYQKELSKHVRDGDLIVNCSLNIDAISLLKWCMDNGVMQIDTSLERWNDEQDEDIPNLADRTLYATHKEIRKEFENSKGKATCCVTHGANPGYATHLAKRALIELAKHKKIKITTPKSKEEWAQLAKKLGVLVIQCSEHDNQAVNVPRDINEFQVSWSPEGFLVELRAPSELGYGSFENKKLENGVIMGTSAYFNKPGAAVYAKSWAPTAKDFNGFLIQHSESVTISQYFETEDKSYRPTVYYCYKPMDAAIASIHEMRGKELDITVKKTVLKNEIVQGKDELGMFLIGEGFAFWHGSQMSCDDARRLVPGESATSLQVAGSILGAIVWMINGNSNNGYTEPEDIPFEEVTKIADPYWEPIISVMTDWNVKKKVNKLFDKEFDENNPLSIENFIVWD